MLNSDMLFRVYCIVVGVKGDYSALLRRVGGVLLTNPLLSKQRAVYRRDSRLGVLYWCLCLRPANNKGGRVGGTCACDSPPKWGKIQAAGRKEQVLVFRQNKTLGSKEQAPGIWHKQTCGQNSNFGGRFQARHGKPRSRRRASSLAACAGDENRHPKLAPEDTCSLPRTSI